MTDMLCDPFSRKRKRSCSPSEASSSSAIASSTKDEPVTPLTPLTPSTPRPIYPSEKKSFTCPYQDCEKAYNRPARLQDHLRSHTDERPFICPNESCTKSFRRQSHLSQHVKSSHTSIRDHACDFEGCSKRFLTATRLRRHKEGHLGRNKYRCIDYPPCNESFRKRNTLQKHIDIEHLQRKPFRCAHVDRNTKQECGAGYDSASKLHAHTTRLHGPAKFICTLCCVDSENGPLVCFSGPVELQKHMKLIHPPRCAQCGLECSSPSELASHIDTKHSSKTLEERRIFKCAETCCDKAFTKRSNLNIHTRSAHSAGHPKPFICGVTDLADCPHQDVALWDLQSGCGRGFTAKASLTSHIRKQHLNRPRESARPPPKGRRRVDSTNEQDKSMLSRLTGAATAAEAREIACVDGCCAWRFKREYDLRNHAKKIHGMTDSEITEAIVEREALAGGRFWCGGVDLIDEHAAHAHWEATGVDEDDGDDVWNIRKSGLPIIASELPPHNHFRRQWGQGQVEMADGGVIDPALI